MNYHGNKVRDSTKEIEGKIEKERDGGREIKTVRAIPRKDTGRRERQKSERDRERVRERDGERETERETERGCRSYKSAREKVRDNASDGKDKRGLCFPPVRGSQERGGQGRGARVGGLVTDTDTLHTPVSPLCLY